MQHYSIVFNTTGGPRRALRINNPNPGLPTNQIAAAVDKIIANDIFDPKRGSLDSLQHMELTTVQTTTIL